MSLPVVAVASDHGGFGLKTILAAELDRLGYPALDLGTDSTEACDYPEFAHRVAAAIDDGRAEIGLLVDGTGIGMSIAANRFANVRAAVIRDPFGARLARQHVDANVLCLGGWITGAELAKECLQMFLDTPFEGGRHARRVAMIARDGAPGSWSTSKWKRIGSMTVEQSQSLRFFNAPLAVTDPEIWSAIGKELGRQQNQIELIASENIVSRAVLEAQGSVLTNKYAEGYSGRRYYGGCEFVDIAEDLAIERAKTLFDCAFANVQPHSGSQANQAVFMALMQPGDTFLGLDLASGGHLTHGSPVNMSGKWFKCVSYGVRRDDQRIDLDQVEALAREHKPKVIVAGGSAYPRFIDFAAFRAIADKVGAYLMVDMAHFAGLVAGGVHPSPLPHAHVVTTTTHKTLRGPRGGLILANDAELGKKINSAIFPGLQGGPLMHVIAAKAVAFGEALRPEFKAYAQSVKDNAATLAATLKARGFDIVSGGTDTHLMLVDLRPKRLTGKVAEQSLDRAAITCNKNGIPFDPEKPTVTSGIRLGSPAATTRGFGTEEFQQVGELIGEVLDGLASGANNNEDAESSVRQRVAELCDRFPIYRQ